MVMDAATGENGWSKPTISPKLWMLLISSWLDWVAQFEAAQYLPSPRS
jgi:hypothetical protein